MPLGSVDSEDGNGIGDDELHTLLPGTREVSADDLSQVLNIQFKFNLNLLKIAKPLALTRRLKGAYIHFSTQYLHK